MHDIIFIDDYTLFDRNVIHITFIFEIVMPQSIPINIVNVRRRTDHGYFR